MAFTLVSTFLTERVRSKLGDGKKRKWTDKTLRRYASEAQRWFLGVLGQYPETGYCEETAELSVPASTEYVSLPSDFGALKGHVMWVRPSDSKVFPIRRLKRTEIQELVANTSEITNTTAPPVGCFLRGTRLHVVPTNSSGWTVGIMYRIEYADLVEGGMMSVDDRYLEIVALRTALFAIGDDERSDNAWAVELRSRMAELIGSLSYRDDETESEQVENTWLDGIARDSFVYGFDDL